MFYHNQFADRTEQAGEASLMNYLWRVLAQRFHLQAVLLLKCDPEHVYFTVVSSFGVPSEPFNGADKEPIAELLKDCFEKHPKAHVHALSGKKVSDRLQRFNHDLKDLHRVWFYPSKFTPRYFVFLGFPESGMGKNLDPEFELPLTQTVFAFVNSMSVQEYFARLKTTEVFVKEVGHDIASSVQANVAKLRNITERRITGEAIQRKTREIEEEMWSAYRVSESLGIVVDPEYRLKEPASFNLIEVIASATNHFLSEAEERHMKILIESQGVLNVWGDKKAIEQAIGQFLSNAIKYGEGGSCISISATERRDDILVRITNKSRVALPNPPELYCIWDFGFRGKEAKELHVNGSGIGLYSAKKIANAHHAKVSADSRNNMTSFYIHLRPEAKLKKELGLLV